jgi:8-oxo-dGTP pyrophosphatase MutT (NUDIX family)
VAERAAVRVVCVDERSRVLLMCWRDPTNGNLVWEPPGGGIEEGERPIDTARRELEEETGLSGEAVLDRAVTVRRHFEWNGQFYDGEEDFFLARFEGPPEISRDGLMDYEAEWLTGHAWLPWDELPAGVQPPEIRAVLTDLDPTGPWASESPPVTDR